MFKYIGMYNIYAIFIKMITCEILCYFFDVYYLDQWSLTFSESWNLLKYKEYPQTPLPYFKNKNL